MVRQDAWLWARPCGQSRCAVRLQGRSTHAGNGEHRHPNRGVRGRRRAHLAMYAAVSPRCTIAERAEFGSLLRRAHSSRDTAAAPCVSWTGSATRWRARVAEPDEEGAPCAHARPYQIAAALSWPLSQALPCDAFAFAHRARVGAGRPAPRSPPGPCAALGRQAAKEGRVSRDGRRPAMHGPLLGFHPR